MKVTLNLVERTAVVADVTFPIFRRHDLDNCTIYMMVIDPNAEWSITVPHDGKLYEIELDQPSWFSDVEYLMGLGHHASNADQFADAHKKALEFLQKIPAQKVSP